MTTTTTSRLAALSGLTFVPAVLALNSVGTRPDAVLAAEVLALLLLVPFFAGLTAALRAAGASRELALTVLGAALIGLAVKLAGVLPDVLAARETLDPAVASAFERLGEVSFVLSLPPFGIALLATAVASRATGLLPAWLTGLAAVGGVLLVANGFALGAEFGPAFLVLLVWVLATSAVLLRRSLTAAAPVALAQS